MLRSLAALSLVFAAVPATAAPALAKVHQIGVVDHVAGAQLRIDLSAPPVFSTRGTSTPPRLVISLSQTHAAAQKLVAPNPLVSFVEVKPLKTTTEFTLGFPREITYDVHTEGKTLVVTLNDINNAERFKAGLDAALRPQKGAKVASLTSSSASSSKISTRADFGGSHRGIRLAQDDGAAGAGVDEDEDEDDDGDEVSGGSAMTYVGFRNNSSVTQVFARMNKRNVKYQVKREGDNLLVLEIQDANIPLRNNRNHLDATFFDSPVKMVTPTEVSSSTPKIRIVIEMKSDVPYEDSRDGVDIVLTFRK